MCDTDMLSLSTAAGLSFKSFSSIQLIVPSLYSFFSLCHSLLKRLREDTAGVLWGCLCTVHVLSLLLCGASDPLCLPLLFVTNAAEHITPSRMPRTERRERERAREEVEERMGERRVEVLIEILLGGRAAPKAQQPRWLN